MTLLKYLLFEEWELPVCNSHVSPLVDRASWQYLWYGQWPKMSLCTVVGWGLFSMVFIHSVFVYAGVQSVLTRIFEMRISRIVPNIARETRVCSVVKGEALCGAYACHACFTVNTNNRGSPGRFCFCFCCCLFCFLFVCLFLMMCAIYRHTHKRTDNRGHTHTHTQPPISSHPHGHTHARTHSHWQTDAQTQTHTHTHSLLWHATHTHTQCSGRHTIKIQHYFIISFGRNYNVAEH